MIIPEVTMGVIPSSINVPRLEARITRIQNRGSAESDDMIPYNGTCEQTKKMRRVTAVHSTFWLKGTLRSGDETSGRMGRKGRTRFKNLTVRRSSELLIFLEKMEIKGVLTARHS